MPRIRNWQAAAAAVAADDDVSLVERSDGRRRGASHSTSRVRRELAARVRWSCCLAHSAMSAQELREELLGGEQGGARSAVPPAGRLVRIGALLQQPFCADSLARWWYGVLLLELLALDVFAIAIPDPVGRVMVSGVGAAHAWDGRTTRVRGRRKC